jgi:DNA-3-methyladenine glycosylase
MIVETEAYAAEGDPACHTWKRPSARELVISHSPGPAFVYLN